MTMPVWNPGYSVGNDILDGQHKKLLALCNEAASCLQDDTVVGDEQFHLILDELLKYAREHFSTEESILASISYPELEQQKTEHFDYVESLTDFLLKASGGHLDKAGVYQFLSDWWLRHILESDMYYKPYLQGKS